MKRCNVIKMTNTDVQEDSDWTPTNLMDCIARDTVSGQVHWVTVECLGWLYHCQESTFRKVMWNNSECSNDFTCKFQSTKSWSQEVEADSPSFFCFMIIIFLYFIYMCICVTCAYHGQLWKSFLSFDHMDPGNWIQVIVLGVRQLYLMSCNTILYI